MAENNYINTQLASRSTTPRGQEINIDLSPQVTHASDLTPRAHPQPQPTTTTAGSHDSHDSKHSDDTIKKSSRSSRLSSLSRWKLPVWSVDPMCIKCRDKIPKNGIFAKWCQRFQWCLLIGVLLAYAIYQISLLADPDSNSVKTVDIVAQDEFPYPYIFLSWYDVPLDPGNVGCNFDVTTDPYDTDKRDTVGVYFNANGADSLESILNAHENDWIVFFDDVSGVFKEYSWANQTELTSNAYSQLIEDLFAKYNGVDNPDTFDPYNYLYDDSPENTLSSCFPFCPTSSSVDYEDTTGTEASEMDPTSGADASTSSNSGSSSEKSHEVLNLGITKKQGQMILIPPIKRRLRAGVRETDITGATSDWFYESIRIDLKCFDNETSDEVLVNADIAGVDEKLYDVRMLYNLGTRHSLVSYGTLANGVTSLSRNSQFLGGGYLAFLEYDYYDFDNNVEGSKGYDSDEAFFVTHVNGAYDLYNLGGTSAFWIVIQPDHSAKKIVYKTEYKMTFWDVMSNIGGFYTSVAGIIAAVFVAIIWGFDYKIVVFSGLDADARVSASVIEEKRMQSFIDKYLKEKNITI